MEAGDGEAQWNTTLTSLRDTSKSCIEWRIVGVGGGWRIVGGVMEDSGGWVEDSGGGVDIAHILIWWSYLFVAQITNKECDLIAVKSLAYIKYVDMISSV